MKIRLVYIILLGLPLASCTASPGVQRLTTQLAASPSSTVVQKTSTPTANQETATATLPPDTAEPAYPPPAYPPPELATPVSDSPAAGICDFYPGDLVTFEMYPDIPSPRCARATPEQRLEVINRTDQVLDFWIGPYEHTLQPGAGQVVDAELGTYLAPGVHRVSTSAYGGGGGPELWLVTDP